jgi:hypothetical protein
MYYTHIVLASTRGCGIVQYGPYTSTDATARARDLAVVGYDARVISLQAAYDVARKVMPAPTPTNAGAR